jgi:hypothetical protein
MAPARGGAYCRVRVVYRDIGSSVVRGGSAWCRSRDGGPVCVCAMVGRLFVCLEVVIEQVLELLFEKRLVCLIHRIPVVVMVHDCTLGILNARAL